MVPTPVSRCGDWERSARFQAIRKKGKPSSLASRGAADGAHLFSHVLILRRSRRRFRARNGRSQAKLMMRLGFRQVRRVTQPTARQALRSARKCRVSQREKLTSMRQCDFVTDGPETQATQLLSSFSVTQGSVGTAGADRPWCFDMG
jgi:hypothetical protein